MTVRTSALTSYATDAAEILDLVEATAWSDAQRAGFYDVTELVSRLCAVSLGLRPSAPPPAFLPAAWPGGRPPTGDPPRPHRNRVGHPGNGRAVQPPTSVRSPRPTPPVPRAGGKKAMHGGRHRVRDGLPSPHPGRPGCTVPSPPSAFYQYPANAAGDTGCGTPWCPWPGSSPGSTRSTRSPPN